MMRRSFSNAQIRESIFAVVAPLAQSSKIMKMMRIQFILIIVAGVALAIAYYNQTFIFAQGVLDWIGDHYILGSFLCTILISLTITSALPCTSILAIGCGFVYSKDFQIAGTILACGIVWIGSCLGAIFAFVLSKYLFRDCVLNFAQDNTRFSVIEQIISRHGVKAAILIRLSPIFPFVITNYIFGVTSIRSLHYMIGLIAILPACIFWPLIGSTLSELSDIKNAQKTVTDSPIASAFAIVGVVLTIAIMVAFAFYARREFKKIEQELSGCGIRTSITEWDEEEKLVEPSSSHSSTDESPPYPQPKTDLIKKKSLMDKIEAKLSVSSEEIPIQSKENVALQKSKGKDSSKSSSSNDVVANSRSSSPQPIIDETGSALALIAPPLTRESKVIKFLRLQFIVIVITIAVLAAIYWHHTFLYAKTILDWIGEHYFAGSFIFILLFIFVTIFAVPASIIAIGCGFIYYHHFGIAGLLIASLIVWIGCSLGAILTFFMSRYLFRDCILRFAQNNTKFNVIEGIIQTHGLKVAVVIRLSPIFPFVISNYIFGVTSIQSTHYILGLIGIFPGCAFYSFIGSTISHLSDIASANSSVTHHPVGLAFLIVGCVLTIIGIFVFTRAARRRFQEYERELQSQSLVVEMATDSEDETLQQTIEENVVLDSPITSNNNVAI